MRDKIIIFIGIVIFHIGLINAFAQGKDRVVPGIIDVHSNISDGLKSPEEVVELAREKGLSVLIFGDSALRKWEYGLWPLKNLIKKTYQENSVLRLGTENYLKKLADLKKKFPDLSLIPTVEVSPYFYWEGSPFSKRRNFSLIDYYKQFLVMGLSPRDYQNIPIVGNRQFFLSKNAIFSLWPILLIIWGLKLLRKRVWGISLMLLGVIFLFNNLPFPTSRFNIYQGNRGVKPYQDLIDYVNQRDGLIFWAHPEMFTQEIYLGVETYTASHPEDLFLTHDYTGFGVTYTVKITEAGDIWDKLLLEYIGGKRKKPVWVIGTSHYTGQSGGINRVETLFFVKEQRQEDILDALRQGEMYVRFNLENKPVVLSEFKVKNLGFGSIQIMIKGEQPYSQEPLKIELIRNGRVFKSLEESSSEWTIAVEDNLSAEERKAYYRLRISSHSSLILSNPIFVDRDKKNL